MSEIKSIHNANLSIDPNQSRSSGNPRVGEELKESIEKLGILNPLTVRPREDKKDRDTNKPTNAGEQEYYIVAGRRRYHAAVQLGIEKIDCVVKDLSEEEAIDASFDENQRRVDISQLELAKSVKKRYDIMAQDLVKNPECPKCNKTKKDFEGVDGFFGHISSAHSIDNPYEESSEGFFTERQIFEEIAEGRDFNWRTVSNLINVSSIPEQFQAFVKIPEERTPQEENIVSDKTREGFTFANPDNKSIVSQKSIDFARFINGGSGNETTPRELVEKTLSHKNLVGKNTNEIADMFSSVLSLWEEWKEVDNDEMSNGAVYQKCVNGTEPQKQEDDDVEQSEEESKNTESSETDDKGSKENKKDTETSSDNQDEDESEKDETNKISEENNVNESDGNETKGKSTDKQNTENEEDSSQEVEDNAEEDSESTEETESEYHCHVSLADENVQDSFKDNLSDAEIEKRVEKAVEILKEGVDE